jgi:hypothetical protein
MQLIQILLMLVFLAYLDLDKKLSQINQGHVIRVFITRHEYHQCLLFK